MVSVTPINTQTAKWQARFDSDFPEGLTFTWADSANPDGYGSGRVVVAIPWPQVVEMAGLDDPVVVLRQFGESRAWCLRVLSYEELRTKPVRLVRVTVDNVEHPMLWSGLVGGLGQRMARQRKRLIESHNMRLAEREGNADQRQDGTTSPIPAVAVGVGSVRVTHG